MLDIPVINDILPSKVAIGKQANRFGVLLNYRKKKQMRKWVNRIAASIMLLSSGFFWICIFFIYKWGVLIEENFIGASVFWFLLSWVIFIKTKLKPKNGLEIEGKSKKLGDEVANWIFYIWTYIFVAIIIFIFGAALMGF